MGETAGQGMLNIDEELKNGIKIKGERVLLIKKNENDKGRKLRYSSSIICDQDELVGKDAGIKIKIGSDNRKTPIPYATRNMQTDSTDFEGIAFAIWSILPDCRVTLEFDELLWNESFPVDYVNLAECLKELKSDNDKKKANGKRITDTTDSRIRHYMRFLYRAVNMKNLYGDRFIISKKNLDIVSKFEDLYSSAKKEGKLLKNDPSMPSEIKSVADSIQENHLEKYFVLHPDENVITEKCGAVKLHDQLPCGLFYKNHRKGKKDVRKENQIFNTGYFDLWGINEKGFHVLELKKMGNRKLGVISELFFYSCLMKDFIEIESAAKRTAADNNLYRGFDDFLEGCRRENVALYAHFLVPELYPFFADEEQFEALINVMNSRNDNVKYDCILFNQEEIIAKFGGEKAFIEKIKEEWNGKR